MNKIVEMIKEQLGEGYSVEAVSVAGNNGSVKNGYCIRKDGENVAPNVYPDDWLSDEETVKQVLDIYKNSAKTGIELGDVFNPKYVLDNVIPVLINKERNADLLEQVINRDFMDLAIVYRVNVKNKDIGTGTYLLHNTHLESLGLSEDDLYNASIKNIASNYRVTSMLETLLGLSVDKEMIPELVAADICGPRMYVVTNSDMTFGANCMLNDSAVDELHDALESDDIVILPSSIHELIALSADVDGDKDYPLKEMVDQINTAELAEKDILSSSIYYHNRQTGWRVA